MMEAEFDRWNSRYDIPSVDKAVGRRPERSTVSGAEIRPPDARRAEDEDLRRVKIFSCRARSTVTSAMAAPRL